jgi:O-antigen/teichoic acid export membrane protein
MSRLRQSFFASFIGNYFGLGLNIVTTVALARLLSPAETGLYSIAYGLINILQALREFGTSSYILQEPELNQAKLSAAVTISIGIGLVLTAIFFVAAPMIAKFYALSQLILIIRLLSLNFLIVALAGAASALLQRTMRFDLLLKIGMAQNLTHAVLSIALAWRGYGALGMTWAAVISGLVSLVGGAHVLKGRTLMRPGLAECKAALHFGVYACAGNILNALCFRLPDLVIGRMLGFDAAGMFSRSNGLITLFESAVMRAITPVTSSALAEIRRSNGDIGRHYLQTQAYVIMIAWPSLALIGLLALPIILLAFGANWLPAVPLARIACCAAVFVTLVNVAASVMSACGEVRRYFWIQAVSLPVLGALLLIGGRANLVGVAWGVVVWSALLAAISLQQAQRLLELSVAALIRPIGAGALSLAATLMPAWLIGLWLPITIDHLFLPSLAGAAAGGGGWLIFLFAARHPLASEIIRLASRARKSGE